MRLERGDERGVVGEYPEVVQDLRDAVVREHGELADAVRKERVWIGVGGRGEGCPGLGYHDLGTFPEEDCSVGGAAHDQCACMRAMGDDTKCRIPTSASFEPKLVPERREGVRHHLRELQRRAVIVVSALERLDESLKRPAEVLKFESSGPQRRSARRASNSNNTGQHLLRKGWHQLHA